MSRIITSMAIAAIMLTASVSANAAPCRDANGKFIKCAEAKPAAPVRCKGPNGKFAKCGTAGAKPV